MNPFGSVTASLLVVNLVDAWLYGSLLAAVAVALTLVFGLGRVVNFAIGAFYALGAYVAYSLRGVAGDWLAILAAAVAVAVFAGAIERVAIGRCAAAPRSPRCWPRSGWPSCSTG